jgi:hypothetical protein
MKTIVYQSYHTPNVPAWIGRCMRTVQGWTTSRGFDYCFDDQLFEHVPPWYRQKVADNVILVSDLARLVLAKELFSRGYDRAIWVDADVVVFDPERFLIDIAEEYAFCREVWIGLGQEGKLISRSRVTNAVFAFAKSNSFLDFYIHACQSIVRHKILIDHLDVSTRFLSKLHDLVPLTLLTDVGLFSPLVMADIVQDTEAALPAYMADFGFPIRAANLCSSFRGKCHDGILMDDGLYEAAIDKLLQTQGAVVNRYYHSHGCPI